MTVVQCVQKNLYHSEEVCSMKLYIYAVFPYKWLRIEHIG